MNPGLQERVGIAETQIDHLEEKIDQVASDLKEYHTETKTKLEEMQAASTKQHKELGEKISNLEKIKDRWIAWAIGAAFAAQIILQNWDQIGRIFGK